jgi:hypothetical protein
MYCNNLDHSGMIADPSVVEYVTHIVTNNIDSIKLDRTPPGDVDFYVAIKTCPALYAERNNS